MRNEARTTKLKIILMFCFCGITSWVYFVLVCDSFFHLSTPLKKTKMFQKSLTVSGVGNFVFVVLSEYISQTVTAYSELKASHNALWLVIHSWCKLYHIVYNYKLWNYKLEKWKGFFYVVFWENMPLVMNIYQKLCMLVLIYLATVLSFITSLINGSEKNAWVVSKSAV